MVSSQVCSYNHDTRALQSCPLCCRAMTSVGASDVETLAKCISAITLAISASMCLAHQLRHLPHGNQEPELQQQVEGHLASLLAALRALADLSPPCSVLITALACREAQTGSTKQECVLAAVMTAVLTQAQWGSASAPATQLAQPLSGPAAQRPPPLWVLCKLLQPGCMGPALAAKAAAVIRKLLFLSPTQLQEAGGWLAAHMGSLPSCAGLFVAAPHSHLLQSWIQLMVSQQMVACCLQLIQGGCA